QGLLSHYHVSRLFHQREPVPLAEPEHHSGGLPHRAAVYPPPGTREQGAAVCPGVQGGSNHRGRGGLYISGHGQLCKAQWKQAYEYHWQLDRPIPAKFLKKTNKLVVG